jgi:hypothetical protein
VDPDNALAFGARLVGSQRAWAAADAGRASLHAVGWRQRSAADRRGSRRCHVSQLVRWRFAAACLWRPAACGSLAGRACACWRWWRGHAPRTFRPPSGPACRGWEPWRSGATIFAVVSNARVNRRGHAFPWVAIVPAPPAPVVVTRLCPHGPSPEPPAPGRAAHPALSGRSFACDGSTSGCPCWRGLAHARARARARLRCCGSERLAGFPRGRA